LYYGYNIAYFGDLKYIIFEKILSVFLFWSILAENAKSVLSGYRTKRGRVIYQPIKRGFPRFFVTSGWRI